jgi:hypothetical protein
MNLGHHGLDDLLHAVGRVVHLRDRVVASRPTRGAPGRLPRQRRGNRVQQRASATIGPRRYAPSPAAHGDGVRAANQRVLRSSDQQAGMARDQTSTRGNQLPA